MTKGDRNREEPVKIERKQSSASVLLTVRHQLRTETRLQRESTVRSDTFHSQAVCFAADKAAGGLKSSWKTPPRLLSLTNPRDELEPPTRSFCSFSIDPHEHRHSLCHREKDKDRQPESVSSHSPYLTGQNPLLPGSNLKARERDRQKWGMRHRDAGMKGPDKAAGLLTKNSAKHK